MFEIKCIIGDKKLVAVLTLLDGHTLEPPVVTPVKEAQTSKLNGHAKPSHPSSGSSSTELLAKFILGRKQVKSSELREYLMARGFAAGGYSHGLRRLLEAGALKKTKTPRVFEVVR